MITGIIVAVLLIAYGWDKAPSLLLAAGVLGALVLCVPELQGISLWRYGGALAVLWATCGVLVPIAAHGIPKRAVWAMPLGGRVAFAGVMA